MKVKYIICGSVKGQLAYAITNVTTILWRATHSVKNGCGFPKYRPNNGPTDLKIAITHFLD